MSARTILIISICAIQSICTARTITVDDDGPADFNTIQAAVNDANDGDTILIKDGLYTGDGNRDIEIRDKSITIKSENGPENCIIDCEGTTEQPHRGFDVRTGRTTNRAITGLTIRNGYAETGAGIRCEQCTLVVSDCILSANTAEQGAGLFCYDAKRVEVTDCTFEYNVAGKDGAGIYCERAGRMKITRCKIRANLAARYGGGVYFAVHGWRTVENSIVVANVAESGAGIYFHHAGNTGLLSSTIAYNTAHNEGGGIFAEYSGPSMLNLILWGNTAQGQSGETAQIDGDSSRPGFSCVQDSDPDDDNVPWGGYNIDDDPMFVRPPHDGGDGWGVGNNDDFGDLHLNSTSPCINAGRCTYYTDPNQFDIDGQPRVMARCVDMGADEFSPTFLVTKPAGSEVWAAGSRHEILWESPAFDGVVDILMSADVGHSWTVVAAGIPDIGRYIWDLPANVNSSTCTIKVVPSSLALDFFTIESELFMINPVSTGTPVVSKWPTQGASTRRAGTADRAGPRLGCAKWEFETDGAVIGSVTIGDRGRIHIACESERLYTLDPNGALLWTYDANTPLLSSPAVGPDGGLYVGAENGTLLAVDPNGQLRWTHSTGAQIYASPAVSEDGIVYVGSMDGVLYALAPNGSELWNMPFKGVGRNSLGSIVAAPAIADDGTIYVGSLYDPNLYALNPTDGTVKWKCSFLPPPDPCDPDGTDRTPWLFTAPVVAPSGTVYQTLLHDSHLYAIDGSDGTILWRTDLADPCSGWSEPNYVRHYPQPDGWCVPALGPDGTIYVSLDDPYLRALSPDGQILWVAKLGAVGGFLLTVDNDGYIYAASDDGDLCVVGPDGVELARYQTDGWPGYPVISERGEIIVSDTRGPSVMMPHARNLVVAITSADCDKNPLALHWPEDIDGDGTVDWPDIVMMTDDWLGCTRLDSAPYPPSQCVYPEGRAYLDGDVDRDLNVDFADWAVLADRWLNSGTKERSGTNR